MTCATHLENVATAVCKFQTTHKPINIIIFSIYTTDLYGPFTSNSELRAAIATTTIELPAWQSIYKTQHWLVAGCFEFLDGTRAMV